MDAIRTHELALARRFYEGVKDVDGVCVYGDFSDFVRAPGRVAQYPGRGIVHGRGRAGGGL